MNLWLWDPVYEDHDEEDEGEEEDE
jgi:hypothetical protein